MTAYIKYSTAISPQQSIAEEFPWAKPEIYLSKLDCIEPNYKEYFPPMKIRRMSRLVKMAHTSAKICLDKAKIDMPDAIITATGWGCLTDTYKYLSEITNAEIATPSPATFIQSTHNTPGGQIALTLGCQNYNNVLVNGNTSFEYGLMDAMMLLNEGKNNVLVGGFDEIAEKDYLLKRASNYWKNEGVSSSDFIEEDSIGTLAGEGSSFFVLSSEAKGCSSYLQKCTVIGCSPKSEIVAKEIENFLTELNLELEDINVIFSGANGDNRIMPLYHDLAKSIFQDIPVCHYKKLCGEYDTASAFALWLADNIIRCQNIPEYLYEGNINKVIRNVLIYNYTGDNKHAITIVSKAQN